MTNGDKGGGLKNAQKVCDAVIFNWPTKNVSRPMGYATRVNANFPKNLQKCDEMCYQGRVQSFYIVHFEIFP